LEISSRTPPFSKLPAHRNTLNWLGDVRLAGGATAQAFLIVFAILTFSALVRTQWTSVPNAPPSSPSGIPVTGNDQSRILDSDRLILALATVFLLGLGLYGFWKATVSLWPGINDDGGYFSTVVINRSGNLGNVYSGYTQNQERFGADLSHNSHGQAYLGLLSCLLKSPDYASLLHALHLINLIGFMIGVPAFAMAFRRSLTGSWVLATFYGTLGSFATLSILLYLQGRPEHGISLLLFIFIGIAQITRIPTMTPWFSGILVGLVGSVSPLPGLIAASATVFFDSQLNEDRRTLVSRVFVRATTALLSWAIATSLAFDGNLWNLVTNTASNGVGLASAWNPAEWDEFWLFNIYAPGLLLIFFPVVFFGIIQASRVFRPGLDLAHKIFLSLAGSFLIVSVWTYGFTWAGFYYTFLGFFPACVIWLAGLAGTIPSHVIRSPIVSRRLVFATAIYLVLALAVIGSGALKVVLLQDFAIHRGLPYHEARGRVEKLCSELPVGEVVMVDAYFNARSAMVLAGIPWRFQTLPANGFPSIAETEKNLGFFTRYFLVLQHYGTQPRPVSGFTLVEDRFTKTPVRLWGRELSPFIPGYGYALYRRDPASSAPPAAGPGLPAIKEEK
jgi:hypothetical protein